MKKLLVGLVTIALLSLAGVTTTFAATPKPYVPECTNTHYSTVQTGPRNGDGHGNYAQAYLQETFDNTDQASCGIYRSQGVYVRYTNCALTIETFVDDYRGGHGVDTYSVCQTSITRDSGGMSPLGGSCIWAVAYMPGAGGLVSNSPQLCF